MNSPDHFRAEENRFLAHLNCIGYTADGEPDPYGWHFATNPMAPPLGFRAGPHFLCLHAEYSAGRHEADEYHDLLREVNRLNATNWLVRCTVIKREDTADARLSIRLQANLPLNMPKEELGACLLTWIRESSYIERSSRLRAYASSDGHPTEDHSHSAVDGIPPQPN